MSGFIGSGTLHFERVVGGVSQGWLRFGNAIKFEIKENAEIKERKSKMRGSLGATLDSVAIKQSAELAITLDDLDKANLALAFLGDVVDGAIVGASITSEAQTAYVGKSVKTDFRNISALAVKDVSEVTTYVLDTDYAITNAEMGFIEILSGGGISDGDVLHLDYTYGTVTSSVVRGGTNSSIKMALKMDGENFADQSKVVVDVWEAVLAPQTGVDFLADDFATIELSGSLVKPDNKVSAYEIEMGVVYS